MLQETVNTVLCPYCGSALVKSPSGQHLVCSGCKRIVLQERNKKPRGRKKGRPATVNDAPFCEGAKFRSKLPLAQV
jgi:hypothetical protein